MEVVSNVAVRSVWHPQTTQSLIKISLAGRWKRQSGSDSFQLRAFIKSILVASGVPFCPADADSTGQSLIESFGQFQHPIPGWYVFHQTTSSNSVTSLHMVHVCLIYVCKERSLWGLKVRLKPQKNGNNLNLTMLIEICSKCIDYMIWLFVYHLLSLDKFLEKKNIKLILY